MPTAPPSTPTDTVVAVEAHRDGGRQHVRLASGLLRAQQVHAAPGWSRVALIASSALLLGGDRVGIDVSVGAGARLQLVEVAATVAYPGPPSGWHVRVRLGAGASLVWSGQPFVVCSGADATRSTELDLDPTSALTLRETLVLGRSGEAGGTVVSGTRARLGDREILVEEQRLGAASRSAPGILAGARVLDSVLTLGVADVPPTPAGAALLRLHEGGAVLRWIGTDAHDSPLGAL